jgi:hypothetical protein
MTDQTDAPDEETLRERYEELVDRAEAEGIDWEPRLEELPDDLRDRIAGLATLLGVHPRQALDPEAPLDGGD